MILAQLCPPPSRNKNAGKAFYLKKKGSCKVCQVQELMFRDAIAPFVQLSHLSPTRGPFGLRSQSPRGSDRCLAGCGIKGALGPEAAQSITAPQPNHNHHESRLCE